MLSVEDWAEIRRLSKSEGLSIKEIARQVGVARNTVRIGAALRRAAGLSKRGDGLDRRCRRARYPPPVDAVPPDAGDGDRRAHRLDAVAHRVEGPGARAAAALSCRPTPPGAPSTALASSPSGTCGFRRPTFPSRPARWPSRRSSSESRGYSRVMVGTMIPSREAHDILSGNLACLKTLGAVPKKGVYDNEGALVSRRGREGHLERAVRALPRDTRHGGRGAASGGPRVQGGGRTSQRLSRDELSPRPALLSPADFNEQLTEWLVRANRRVHATLRCRPVDRFEEDRAAMMALPPVLPDTALRLSTRLARDHWVRVGTCDYSVHPKVIGRLVEIRVSVNEVIVTCAGEVVGRHLRSWAKHRTITDPEHDRARDLMRNARLSVPTTPLADEVEVRDLSVYDRATGVA